MLLDAPDTVLIERAFGKRIDPETGGNSMLVLIMINPFVKCNIFVGTVDDLSLIHI